MSGHRSLWMPGWSSSQMSTNLSICLAVLLCSLSLPGILSRSLSYQRFVCLSACLGIYLPIWPVNRVAETSLHLPCFHHGSLFLAAHSTTTPYPPPRPTLCPPLVKQTAILTLATPPCLFNIQILLACPPLSSGIGCGRWEDHQDLLQQPRLTPLHYPRELQGVFLQWDSLLLVVLLYTLLEASSGSSWHCPAGPGHSNTHMPVCRLLASSEASNRAKWTGCWKVIREAFTILCRAQPRLLLQRGNRKQETPPSPRKLVRRQSETTEIPTEKFFSNFLF